MDLHANKTEQAELASALEEQAVAGLPFDEDDATRLAELVVAHARWVTAGGFSDCWAPPSHGLVRVAESILEQVDEGRPPRRDAVRRLAAVAGETAAATCADPTCAVEVAASLRAERAG